MVFTSANPKNKTSKVTIIPDTPTVRLRFSVRTALDGSANRKEVIVC